MSFHFIEEILMLQHLTHMPSTDQHETQIIMFHGFGADNRNIFDLAEMIAPEFTWHFPNGGLEVQFAPGFSGRAWWTIDFQRMSLANYDFGQEIPRGLPDFRKKTLQWFEKNKFDWSKTILAGFSQGGMAALDLYLQAPVTPKGLMLFSSALINKVEQTSLMESRKGESFFLTHGKADQVLPHRCGQQLETFLNLHGLKGRLLSFAGGHEIPLEIISKARGYIMDQDQHV